jgi:hypothetical protein
MLSTRFKSIGGFEYDARLSSLTTTKRKRKRGSRRFISILVSRDIDDETNLDYQGANGQKGAFSATF